MARLDRLGPGRGRWRRLAPRSAASSPTSCSRRLPLPGTSCKRALTRLVAAELIFRRGTPPDAVYSFKHALVQDAAYGTLLRARGRNCMRASPSALAAFREPPSATRAVRPSPDRGRPTRRAVDLLAKAGRACRGAPGHPEAIAHFRRALPLLAAEPECRSAGDELVILSSPGPVALRLVTTEGASAVERATSAIGAASCESSACHRRSWHRQSVAAANFRRTRSHCVPRFRPAAAVTAGTPTTGSLLQAHHSAWTTFCSRRAGGRA